MTKRRGVGLSRLPAYLLDTGFKPYASRVLSRLILETMLVSRSFIERIGEATVALGHMQSLLWSEIERQQRLFAQGHFPSLSDGERQEREEKWARRIKIEIPRQAGYALLVLDCSGCEAFLEEAIQQRLIDSFVHLEASGKRNACGINDSQCRSAPSPDKVTCHRCKRSTATEKSSASRIDRRGLPRLKEEARLVNLHVEEQNPLWDTVEDLYAIRCFIVHQGGRLKANDIGGQNQTLESLKERYQKEFNLVRQGEDGDYIWAVPRLCDQFREATHELLVSVGRQFR